MEKALDDLKLVLARIPEGYITYTTTVPVKSLKIAIQALEKQVPMKPIDRPESWRCPNCNNKISHDQQLMHCRSCGQLVTWRFD